MGQILVQKQKIGMKTQASQTSVPASKSLGHWVSHFFPLKPHFQTHDLTSNCKPHFCSWISTGLMALLVKVRTHLGTRLLVWKHLQLDNAIKLS